MKTAVPRLPWDRILSGARPREPKRPAADKSRDLSGAASPPRPCERSAQRGNPARLVLPQPSWVTADLKAIAAPPLQ